jgi:hypothetical protein
MDRAVAQVGVATPSSHPATEAPIPVAPAPRSIPAAQAAPSAAPTAVPSIAATATPSARLPVVIFDQTRHRDVVVAFRSALRAAGWDVDGTGPWIGKVPVTTVYYPVGMESAAKALMAAFPQITRSLPAFSGVPSDELTVIICSDFRLN